MPERTKLSHTECATLYALAVLSSWWVGSHGPVYWDTFGYVIQSIHGRVGGLMLGRPAFVLISHGFTAVWRAGGGSLRSVEPMLRVTWSLVSALATPWLAAVALELKVTKKAAYWAGAAVALSPAVAHTSHAVLTDAPSMALFIGALLLGVRATFSNSLGMMLSAGVVLGVSAGLREQAVLQCATLVALAWTNRRRLAMSAVAVSGCLATLGAMVLWLAVTQRSYFASIHAWADAMGNERAQHPYGMRDLGMYFAWLMALGVVPLWVLVRGVRRVQWNNVALAAILPSVVQLVLLAGYQDIAFSPRYLLGAWPCAVVLTSALAWDVWQTTERTRTAAFVALVIGALLAGPALNVAQQPLRDGIAALPERLRSLPQKSAVVTGQLCPAVVYERELTHLEGTTLDVIQICSGWRWPASLPTRLDKLLREGRTVVIDLRRNSWIGPRQLANRNEAMRYANAHRDTAGLVVWR
jgi:hypothetical protein